MTKTYTKMDVPEYARKTDSDSRYYFLRQKGLSDSDAWKDIAEGLSRGSDSCEQAVTGKVKYCGYVVGKEISCEQVERLYHYLHANYHPVNFIQLTDADLHRIAEDNREEWE